MMVIWNPSNELFWSNRLGWTSFELCSRFETSECIKFNKPMGGFWYCESDGRILSAQRVSQK